jgi:hypothetical protein
MPKTTGLGDRLYVDGSNLSGDIGSLQGITGGPAALDVTAIDKSAPERLGGLRTGAINFTAWFNPSAGQEHAVLKTLPYGNRVVTYGRGAVLGAPAASCVAKQIGYDPNRNADGSLTLPVTTTSDGFGLEWGLQFTAGVRTDTTATNGTSIDNGAATALGAQFYLHVIAITGTSVTVTMQDSADNVSFANITGGVFAAAAVAGAQRIAVTGNVRRYVRAITTGTFTNAQFVVNGVRNETVTAF